MMLFSMNLHKLHPVFQISYKFHCSLINNCEMAWLPNRWSFQQIRKIVKKRSESSLKIDVHTVKKVSYGNDALEIIQKYKKLFKSGHSKPDYAIVDTVASSTLMMHALEDLQDGDTILEMNPGPGLLTEQLVKHCKDCLLLFEHREGFIDRLTETYSKEIEVGQIKIHKFNFGDFYRYFMYHKLNGNIDLLNTFLDVFPIQKSHNRSNLKIVGVVTNPKFIGRISISTLLNLAIFEKISPTFFLYVPDKLYKKFFTNFPFIYHNNHFKHSLQNHYIFNFTKLATVSSACFYPPLKGKKNPGIHNIDASIFHLMKIEPNWSFLKEFDLHERELFMFFLAQISDRSSTNLLLDTMERWLPGIGVQLIDAGFKVFTYCQELSKEEIMFVYHMFRGQPNFEGSSFIEKKDLWLDFIQGKIATTDPCASEETVTPDADIDAASRDEFK